MPTIICNNQTVELKRCVIEEPKVCVVCGSATARRKSSVKGNVKVGAVTECTNAACSAKSYGKLKTFIKKVDILGIGDAVLEAMVESSMVSTIPDLYRIREESLALLTAGTQVGKKRAASITKEIQAKRKLTIDQLLGSLGIQHLGRRRVQLIRENILTKTGVEKFNYITAWLDGELLEYREVAGVPGIADAIQAGIDRSRNLIEDLLQYVTLIDPPAPKVANAGGSLNGQKFCLTGTMSRKRAEIAKDIEAAGGNVVDDVTNNTVTLVQADPSSESSKSKKAKKVGANVISEEQLMALMGK